MGNFFRKANVLVGGCGGIPAGVRYHCTCHARACSPRKSFKIEITSEALSSKLIVVNLLTLLIKYMRMKHWQPNSREGEEVLAMGGECLPFTK